MTAAADALDAIRAAVAAGAPSSGVGAAIDADAFADAHIVVRPDGGEIDWVALRPVEPTTVADLEGTCGPAGALPRSPSDGGRTVLFRQTLPADGESGATVL